MIELNFDMMLIFENLEEESNYIFSEIIKQFSLENLSEVVVLKPGEKIDESKAPFGLEFDPKSRTDRGFDKEPYFKLFSKGQKFGIGNNEKERCRISMSSAIYIYHNKPAATWKLSKSQKELLIKLLSSNIKLVKNDNIITLTVWEFMFWYSNNVAMVKLDLLPMPDYMQL